MSARARRPRRDEQGASAVEFALVVPILLAVILGILQYGYHYWALETASATAREAARRLAVGTEWACTRDEAMDRLAAPAVDTVPTPTYSFASGAASATIGDIVVVTVSLQSLDIGFLPLPGSGAITETARARVENVPSTALTC